MSQLHDALGTVGGRWGALLARCSLAITGARLPRPTESAVDSTAREFPAADASADMGWLSLSEDAGGHSLHEGEVTFLGLTPDDIDAHDADGGDLSWISLGH